MSKLKLTTLILSTSFLVCSCASNTLTFEESNILINSLENKTKESEFKFPTKITYSKLSKHGNTYTDKHAVRFSLEDKYFYYCDGYQHETMNEYWFYVDDDQFYSVSSTIKEGNRVKRYYAFPYDGKTNFFNNKFIEIKKSIYDEYDTFRTVLSLYNKIDTSNSANEILVTSISPKNAELTAHVELESETIEAKMIFTKCLPSISNLYKVANNKEIINYETKYEYIGVNITKPNIKNFEEMKK